MYMPLFLYMYFLYCNIHWCLFYHVLTPAVDIYIMHGLHLQYQCSGQMAYLCNILQYNIMRTVHNANWASLYATFTMDIHTRIYPNACTEISYKI